MLTSLILIACYVSSNQHQLDCREQHVEGTMQECTTYRDSQRKLGWWHTGIAAIECVER